MFFKKHILKINFIILLFVISFFGCSTDGNPLGSEVDFKPKIVINEILSKISVQTNPNNGNLESEIYHLVGYHFENCYGIVDNYSVELDTFGGVLYNMDYFQPYPPHIELILTHSFWMRNDFNGLDSVSIYIRLYSMFWADSSFNSEILGDETIEYSNTIQIIRKNM